MVERLEPRTPLIRDRLYRAVIDAMARCHLGQSLDLSFAVWRLERADINRLVATSTMLKTGALMELAARLGAVVGGAPAAREEALTRFGRRLGVGPADAGRFRQPDRRLGRKRGEGAGGSAQRHADLALGPGRGAPRPAARSRTCRRPPVPSLSPATPTAHPRALSRRSCATPWGSRDGGGLRATWRKRSTISARPCGRTSGTSGPRSRSSRRRFGAWRSRMRERRVAIIGSGFGGLAAAIRLQAAGARTVLYEAQGQPGGRAGVFQESGYTFDLGPTVITAPHCLEELFALANERLADHVTLSPVAPFYRLHWADGARFDYGGTPESVKAQVAALAPGDVDGFERFMAYSRRVFEAGYEGLVDAAFLRFADMVRVAPQLARLRADRSVYGAVSRFVKDERLRQALSFHALLIGGNPFETSAIYTLIPFLERKWGVFFPQGGTGALIRALADLYRRLGGELRLDARVDRVEVRTEGGRDAAPGVVGGRRRPGAVRRGRLQRRSAPHVRPHLRGDTRGGRHARTARAHGLVDVAGGRVLRHAAQVPRPRAPHGAVRPALPRDVARDLSRPVAAARLQPLPAPAHRDRSQLGAARRRDVLRPGPGAPPRRGEHRLGIGRRALRRPHPRQPRDALARSAPRGGGQADRHAPSTSAIG